MEPHWASRYIEIPFLPKGRDYDGCDCWGLVRLVLRDQFKTDVPSYVDSYQSPNDTSVGVLLEIAQYAYATIEQGWEQPGDIVVIRTGRLKYHVGVVIGGYEMLHVMHGSNAVIQRYDVDTGVGRLMGFYRA